MRAPIGLVAIAGSFTLTTGVIANAYFQKKQFYPSVVYITKSNPSMAVLYIQAFVFVIILAKLMRKVFFGQLRAVEMEHLIERSWYAVTETCLAFTVFRDDFSTMFVAMFTLLLFLKCFHWLAEDRIDYMETSPVITWKFHIRALCLLSFLCSLDGYFISHAYHSTLTKGASVQLVFGFEYAILLTIMTALSLKYVLHIIDLQSEIPWDNKAVYLLYTELVVGGIKVILYSAFMVIMIKVHTFPLFAIRPMYLTLRGFKKALNDVIMSRRAIRNMNNLYPDATAEDLSSGDNVCIICREEMLTNCKKLPCNHIFHTSCLRSWFQRQQTCPTCRMDVLRNPRPVTETPPAQQPAQLPDPQQPNPMNFYGFPFGAWPQNLQFPQMLAQPGAAAAAPAPAAAAAPAPSASVSSAQTPPSSATGFPGVAPFMMPPMFMPPMPFTVPPPMPSNDFHGLQDEELRNLEGHERRNVEARIECLRNIQVLLDAAVVQMQQYSSVVANLQPAATSTTVTSSATAQGSIPTVSADTETKLKRSRKSENLNLDYEGLEGAVGVSAPKSGAVSSDVMTAPPDDEEDLEGIRQRRIDRFSIPTTAAVTDAATAAVTDTAAVAAVTDAADTAAETDAAATTGDDDKSSN